MTSFRFKKNDRGFSDLTFPILHNLIIGTTNLIFRVRVTGREHMPTTGPCFIFGNHSNYFDPFFLNVLMKSEPTAGVMTREQFHKTVPALAMDSVGIVPTSKYVPEPGVVRSVVKMMDQRRMVVIFPEGGRRWDGRPKGLIESTMKLFWKLKVPVHPVQLHGSFLTWPRWADHPRPGSVEARWLKPLHPSDFADYDTFAEACRQAIRFDEYEPPVETLPVMGWKPASGIQRFLYRCPVTGSPGAVYSPDGHEVRSHAAPAFRYRMDIHSRLIDRDGASHNLLEVYDGMNRLPMTLRKDGTLLSATHRPIYTLNDRLDLVRLPDGDAVLTPEAFIYTVDGKKQRIPVDDVKYISIEGNHKLSLYPTTGGSVQINLEGQSALAWQIYLRRLQSGERAG